MAKGNSMLDKMKAFVSSDSVAGKLRDRSKVVEKASGSGEEHSGSNYYDDGAALKRNNDEIRKRRSGGY
jgi:hypothetical protein